MHRSLLDNPFLSSVIFLGSLVGCCYALVQGILAAIAWRWPTAEGEILEAHLIQTGFDARGLQARVVYSYTVDGHRFVNDRVRFGPQPQRASIIPAAGYSVATTNVAGLYPVGRRVRVRYNPRRPGDSVLHAQPNLAVILIFAIAVATLVVFFERGTVR